MNKFGDIDQDLVKDAQQRIDTGGSLEGLGIKAEFATWQDAGLLLLILLVVIGGMVAYFKLRKKHSEK